MVKKAPLNLFQSSKTLYKLIYRDMEELYCQTFQYLYNTLLIPIDLYNSLNIMKIIYMIGIYCQFCLNFRRIHGDRPDIPINPN